MQRRSRRAALIGLAVFVGIVSALSISLVAGARRSSSVVDRFFSAAPPYDAQIFAPTLARSDVLALPGVKRADPNSYIGLMYVGGSRETVGFNGIAVDFTAPANPTRRLLKGNWPDGTDPLTVVVNEFFARQFGKSVGDRVPVQMFSTDQYDEVQQGIYEPRGPKFDLTIAAVVRLPEDIAHTAGPSGACCPSRFGNSITPSFSILARPIRCGWPTAPRDCPRLPRRSRGSPGRGRNHLR
jgi:hypothetical protein